MEKPNTPTNAQLIESLIERINKQLIAEGRPPLKEGPRNRTLYTYNTQAEAALKRAGQQQSLRGQ